MSDTQAPDIVEHMSAMPFDATVERLVQTIAGRGMTIFARIDHAANARAVGMTMLQATVLIYGNARGARRSCSPRQPPRSTCRSTSWVGSARMGKLSSHTIRSPQRFARLVCPRISSLGLHPRSGSLLRRYHAQRPRGAVVTLAAVRIVAPLSVRPRDRPPLSRPPGGLSRPAAATRTGSTPIAPAIGPLFIAAFVLPLGGDIVGLVTARHRWPECARGRLIRFHGRPAACNSDDSGRGVGSEPLRCRR